TTGNGVVCFGNDDQAELGDQMTRMSACDVTALDGAGAPLSTVVEVAVGDSFSCARHADGRIDCWGDDTYGQVGNGAFMAVVAVPWTVPLRAPATQLTAGNDYACVLLDDQSIWCWGINTEGQLGNGSNVGNSAVPTQVVLPPCTP